MLRELTRPMAGHKPKEQPKSEAKLKPQLNLSPLFILGGLGVLGGLFLFGEDTPIEEAPVPLVEQPKIQLIYPELIRFATNGGLNEVEWQFGEGYCHPPTNMKDAKKAGRAKSMVDGRNADKISFTLYDDWANAIHDIDVGIIKVAGYEYLDIAVMDRNDPHNITSMVCDSMEEMVDAVFQSHVQTTHNVTAEQALNVAEWMAAHVRQGLPKKHRTVLGLELPDPHCFDLDLWDWKIEKLPISDPNDEADSIERFRLTGVCSDGQYTETVIERYLSICPIGEPEEGILLATGDTSNHDPYTGAYIMEEQEIEIILRNHSGLFPGGVLPHKDTRDHLELIAQLSNYILHHMRPSTALLLG